MPSCLFRELQVDKRCATTAAPSRHLPPYGSHGISPSSGGSKENEAWPQGWFRGLLYRERRLLNLGTLTLWWWLEYVVVREGVGVALRNLVSHDKGTACQWVHRRCSMSEGLE